MNSPVFGCYRNTIRVRSGGYFDIADPRPGQFTFADVAGALSKICRFGGQIDRFYSVAEHLWHCAEQAARDGLSGEAQRAVLLHDAAEAFIGDVVKPLKVMLPEYAAIEQKVEDCIALKFGVSFRLWQEEIRKVDRELLIAERHGLFTADDVKWTGEDEVRRLKIDFYRWSPPVAEEFFTNAARNLGIDVKR